jgi:hypothetical protein
LQATQARGRLFEFFYLPPSDVSMMSPMTD